MKLKLTLEGVLLQGVLASLLVGGPASADLRAPILGAEPVLPARFVPRQIAPGQKSTSIRTPLAWSKPILPARFVPTSARTVVVQKSTVWGVYSSLTIDPDRLKALVPSPALWYQPLLDRKLSVFEKDKPIAGELLEAVARIEPIFDPTRLEGPESVTSMSVSSGTASMDSVFGDRWHRTYADPNINAKVDAIALAWQRGRRFSCDGYVKNRAHRPGEPALTMLDVTDCLGARHEGVDSTRIPEPIVTAQISVPVFAAPQPGTRLSSEDFWAKRRARIAEVEAQLRQRKAQQEMREKISLGRFTLGQL